LRLKRRRRRKKKERDREKKKLLSVRRPPENRTNARFSPLAVFGGDESSRFCRVLDGLSGEKTLQKRAQKAKSATAAAKKEKGKIRRW